MHLSKAMSNHQTAGSNCPLVSVIIPTFNYGHFVTDAIASLQDQRYCNLEIIVVDDGSTDETANILKDRTDIRYIYQSNQGLSSARNRGMREATGKYLMFLDADDLVGETSISNRVTALNRGDNLSFVVGRSANFHHFALPEKLAFLHHRWRLPPQSSIAHALCYANIAPAHAFMVRREVVERCGLVFDPILRACEDYDFWIRLALASCSPTIVSGGYVYYRQHSGSMSRVLLNQALHDAEMCRRVLGFFENRVGWFGMDCNYGYLYSMYAGSLLTARRLWATDRIAYAKFMEGHVFSLHKRLGCYGNLYSVERESSVFILKSMATLQKMFAKERAIDWTTYERLLSPLPNRKRCYLALVKPFHFDFDTLRILVQAICSDLLTRLSTLRSRFLNWSA